MWQAAHSIEVYFDLVNILFMNRFSISLTISVIYTEKYNITSRHAYHEIYYTVYTTIPKKQGISRSGFPRR